MTAATVLRISRHPIVLTGGRYWRHYWASMLARAMLTYLIFIDVAYSVKLLTIRNLQYNNSASYNNYSPNGGGGGGASNGNNGANGNTNGNGNGNGQDQVATMEQQQQQQCCACDEAKYELVFEGLWSRYTHPDDFPENYWLAHFSDIIGASHSAEFRMWAHDQLATDGVRELAETGSTKKLEAELKKVSSKTRTIIKARELRYPTLNGKTSAVFRTDRHHHLVSILSKLNPSPDWILGVSGLELCQPDCSWAMQRVVNLYLWDAGTDSGTSFTAPDSPSRPQERIHPFRKERRPANNQTAITPAATNANAAAVAAANEQQADFDQQAAAGRQRRAAYDFLQAGEWPPSASAPTSTESTAAAADQQSKPYARLTITRQRIYEKSCQSNEPSPAQAMSRRPSSNSNGGGGGGSYYSPAAAAAASSSSSMNPLEWAEQSQTSPSVSDCRYTDWSDWSSCSSNCGKGIRTRTRGFVDEQAHLSACSQTNLIEKEICLSECVGNVTCVTRDWSDWSRCSVTCGQGIRKRTRSPIGTMRKACGRIELSQSEVCIASHNVDCSPVVEPTACEVSEWSQWSKCSVACGRGTRIRTRQYLRKDGLEHCNTSLIQKTSCTGRLESCQDSRPNAKYLSFTCLKPVDPGPCRARLTRWHYDAGLEQCSRFYYGGCLGNANNFETFQDCESYCLLAMMNDGSQANKVIAHNPNLPVIDCKLSGWSPWSTCSALCGEGRRTRSRYIIQMPQNGGKPCDRKLSRTQKCKDLPPCPPNYALVTTTAPTVAAAAA